MTMHMKLQVYTCYEEGFYENSPGNIYSCWWNICSSEKQYSLFHRLSTNRTFVHTISTQLARSMTTKKHQVLPFVQAYWTSSLKRCRVELCSIRILYYKLFIVAFTELTCSLISCSCCFRVPISCWVNSLFGEHFVVSSCGSTLYDERIKCSQWIGSFLLHTWMDCQPRLPRWKLPALIQCYNTSLWNKATM